jgi:hypothetical protein
MAAIVSASRANTSRIGETTRRMATRSRLSEKIRCSCSVEGLSMIVCSSSSMSSSTRESTGTNVAVIASRIL